MGISMDNAARMNSTEDRCESATHGRFSTLKIRRERQAYANSVVVEWQRTHPTLPFADLLALFRLAGKEYDRNSGRV